MRAGQDLRQSQSQRIAPRIIAANRILKLSAAELQQAIEVELAENPALQAPDDDPCSSCDQPRVLCVDCPLNKHMRSEILEASLTVYDEKPGREFSFDDEDLGEELLLNVSSQVTLEQYLLPLVSSVVPSERHYIAEYLIANIRETGYLDISVEQASIDLKTDMELVEETLAGIHQLDPPGIGARDLRECLHVQLLRLAEDGQGNDIALHIVNDFWDEMISAKYERIAKKLKLPLQQVTDAISFIKNHLAPYPGAVFRRSFEGEVEFDVGSVRPDIVVTRTTKGYSVEVVGYDAHFLHISSRYLSMYQDIKEGHDAHYSVDDKAHITAFVERAESFVNHINQRKRTLKRIAECVINFHEGYLETSSKAFMRPLTRTMVAQKLGLHEATVSRASSNKYIQLPTEEVVPFESLFDVSASVKDMIMELIAKEDPSQPLSDQQIVEILTSQGLDVARRTVAKYREDEKILSSRKRRLA